jgi:hypothetical protein
MWFGREEPGEEARCFERIVSGFFATAVASGHATLATKRTLLLTWAGLSPAGSHQLFLAHLFDHLVGTYDKGRWNFNAHRLHTEARKPAELPVEQGEIH